MTKAETIEHLEYLIFFRNYPTEKDIKALKMATAALQEAEQGWIPCSDRLPLYANNYLCTMTLREDEEVRFLTIGHFNKELKPFWTDDNKLRKTVAWRALPEPWKGERRNGD